MKRTIVQTFCGTSLAIILLLTTYTLSLAQHGAIEWEKNYGMAGEDAAYDIIQTNDSGYVFCGQIEDSLTPGYYYNLWVMKLDASGDSVWSSIIEVGHYQNDGKSIVQTSDGGYMITGKTRLVDTTDACILVVKLSSDGTKEWHKVLGNNYLQDEGYKVIETYDKAFVICGYSMTYSIGNSDGWLMKIDSLGNEIWTLNLGGSNWDFFGDVIQAEDSTLVAVGYKNGFTDCRLWVIKVAADGMSIIWDREYGQAPSLGTAYSIKETADNGYIVAGRYQLANGNPNQYFVLRIDELGYTVWTRTYGDNSNKIASSIEILDKGGYIVTGQAWYSDLGSIDMWVLRITNGGDSVWSKSYGGSYVDKGSKIIQVADGGYILAGIKGVSSGNFQACIIKIAPDFDAGVNSHKLGDADDINIYPNPSNGEFTIEINPSTPLRVHNNTTRLLSGVETTITDITGKIVYNKNIDAQTRHASSLHVSTDLNKGIYFIKIETENQMYIKKLIIH